MTNHEFSYCTDEDILLRVPKDFALLCPRLQYLAAGNDGSFLSADRWTLRSASGGFDSRGIEPGQVVRLLGPSTALGASDDLLVVTGVGADSLSLRRAGQPADVGAPPGPAGGASGVDYSVLTLRPQIAQASREVARRFGIDEHLACIRSSDHLDRDTWRNATVLSVIRGRYLDLGRGPGGRDDPLLTKADAFAVLLDELLARTVVRQGDGTPSQAIAFQAMIIR